MTQRDDRPAAPTVAGDDLARTLTDRITALDGVRGLFPSHAVAAAVLAAVAAVTPATALVGVDIRDGVVRVTARLATDRRTPSSQVIAQVGRTVGQVVGARPLSLRIELAHID